MKKEKGKLYKLWLPRKYNLKGGELRERYKNDNAHPGSARVEYTFSFFDK